MLLLFDWELPARRAQSDDLLKGHVQDRAKASGLRPGRV